MPITLDITEKDHEKTEMVDIETDIDRILKEAAMRATDEYELGRKEALESIYENFIKEYKESLEKYAEVFYDEILKHVPAEGIVQHRIGLDPSTGIPTVLSIISAKYEDSLTDIYEVAYLLSYKIYGTSENEYQFWIITDHRLDQDLIDQDFPYRRKG